MIAATFTIFYLAVALYAAGTAIALDYAARGGEHKLRHSYWLVAAGALCLLAVFVLRLAQWRLLPMSTAADTLSLMVLLSTGIVFLLFRQTNRHSLMCFYWPPLALLLGVAAFLAPGDLGASPKALQMVVLLVHVGLAYFAFALFLVASITSLAYMFQAHHLKRKRTQGLFQKLPSLQQLDQTLYTLIAFGYPLFVVTTVIGLVWAYFDSTELSPAWWYSPKVAVAAAMALLYAVCFHARARNLLRGPKLANLVFVGFAVILLMHLLLNVFQLGEYNFWDNA